MFPALGVEAVRRAPPESRGVAMGAYTACLDIALGVSGPMLGVIAGRTGLSQKLADGVTQAVMTSLGLGEDSCFCQC